MTEKQADTMLEFLDRIASSLEKLVELEARKHPLSHRPRGDDPPAWTRNLPPRDKPPDSEL